MTQMITIDKKASTWFVHTGAFRLPSPDGHNFEPGVKYRMHQTEWMKGQPTIEATDMDDDVEPRVQKVKPTKDLALGAQPKENA